MVGRLVTSEARHPYAVEMGQVHDTFRREYGLLPGFVKSVAVGDTVRAAFVVEHIEMVTALLHAHHEGEDRYFWPRLLERAPAELTPMVERMEWQHAAIAAGLTELTARLADWRSDAGADARDELVATVEHFVSALDEHLSDEETYVVPLLERHISQAEWDEQVAHSGTGVPREQLPLIFGIVMHDAPDEVVDAAISNLPPEVRPVIKQLSGTLYAAHYARLHETG